MENKRYTCNQCGFKWQNPNKNYESCPECQSPNITTTDLKEENLTAVSKPGNVGRGRGNMGGGPPRACKCHKCGYETTKTPGAPCRNQTCPECGTPLCGSD
jgi:predicted Zn-ribbon and HTH transcriptional regulator